MIADLGSYHFLVYVFLTLTGAALGFLFSNFILFSNMLDNIDSSLNSSRKNRRTHRKPKLKPGSSPSQLPSPLTDVTAGLESGFCGINQLHLSRVPHGLNASTSWHTLLSVIHPDPLSPPTKDEATARHHESKSWPPDPALTKIGMFPNADEVYSGIQISRVTLMTLLSLTNARPIFSYSSASGHRSVYPSYCGQWSIAWPIGKPCRVSFAAHDSHTAAKDVYPRSFPARVDKCVQMLAGIVTDGKQWKLAFPGRVKSEGPWALRHRKRGFPGAHGSRHLWNMVGGNVWEVDLLYLERCTKDKEVGGRRLDIVAVNRCWAAVSVTDDVQMLLDKTLDCLPWNSLSWSMHRGLRDILLAYGKSVMDQFRAKLAVMVKNGVKEIEGTLVRMGWNADFVLDSLADLAESSILSGGGNSGDLVRVVVAVVECLLEASEVGRSVDKDKTDFWSRENRTEDMSLNLCAAVALTKFFVLEWSQELDYQLYHELPVELYLA